MTLRNNTVKNCLNGGPLFYFRFNNKIDDFVIESSNFVENSVSEYWDSDAESLITPQIWVENSKNGDHGTKFEFIFDDCYFNKNTSPNEGGAIHYGKGKSLFNTRVVFQNCLFNENTAKNGGSAIAVESYQGCEINNCTFTKNKSEDGQGTVYIKTQFSLSEPKENEILITKCTFKENECKESHAIHIIESVNLIHISFCKFNDCGKNDYVISIKTQVQSISFENNTFQFTKFDTTPSAICFHSENFNLIGNSFKKIKNTVVRFYSDMKEKKQFQLIENNFTACSGDSIIDAENEVSLSPIIKGNRFEDISILSQLMILKLNNAINDIVFDNNTFSNFNINTESGGIGLEINHESTEVSFLLSFNDCIFICNNNKENKQQGSAISCNNYINRGNIRLSVNNCLFEENNNNGKGCAIYANIQHDITIKKCNFSNNIGLEKGSVYIDSDGSYTLSSLVSISQCKFNKNQVSGCSSIYIAPSTTKTVKIDFCTFEEEKGGLLFDNFKNTIEIKNCNFHNTLDSPALVVQHPKDSLSESTITIIGCTFDSCKGIDNKCFDINSHTRYFTFENNIVQNNRGTGHNNYFGTFNLNEEILTFSIYNISFINNVCDSLYGGGIGIQFYGISQLTFYKCFFKENCAKKDTTISRPTQNFEQTYYNGDGGAIQIGYICTTNNVNVQFKECNFSDNHAERHGGALAIQTTMIVHILDCIFENNLADYDFNPSSKLLTENHFHKKNEGRGGAIYINPSYTYNDDSLNCKSPDLFMQEVQIKGCKFVKNNAFDGYAIYVEGDDNEMPFTVSNNKFIDNYNENNHNIDKNKIYGAVITTEITCIKENEVNLENIFSYGIPELYVRNISYVDHYGKTPSHAFSKSDAFTQSDLFPSMSFTESFIFSPSLMFSNSKAFSNSNAFPKTDEFSKSDYFTKSDAFMKTNQFTKSDCFTKSDTFSKSNQFSKSDAFMKTNPFSKSNYFTQSKAFSKSSQFSKSDDFMKTSQFSKSDAFSRSNQFSSSNKYTQSNAFSNSNTLTPIVNDETSTKNDATISTSNEEYIIATTIENPTNNLAAETQPIAITDTPTDANKITETITDEKRITDTPTAINDNKDPIITKEHSLIQETIEDKPTKQVTKSDDKQESLLVGSSDLPTNEEFGGGSDNSAKSSKKSNKSLIIGVVVGIVVLAIIVVLLIIFIIRKKRNSRSTDDNSANEMTSNENVISCTNSEIPEFDNPLFNNENNQNDPFEQIFEEALV